MSEHDPYLYPGSDVLMNRAAHRDPAAARQFTVMRMAFRGLSLPDVPPSPSTLGALHHHLFQDVYDWAGAYRTVPMSRDGARLTEPSHIAEAVRTRFDHLNGLSSLSGLSADRFARGAAEHVAALEAIHPFRAGSDEVLKLHLEQLARGAGHGLDLSRLNTDLWNRGSANAVHNDERLLTHAIASMMTPQRDVGIDTAIAEVKDLRDAARDEIHEQMDAIQNLVRTGHGSSARTRELRGLREELSAIEAGESGGILRSLNAARESGLETITTLPGRDGSARDAVYALGRGAVRAIEVEAAQALDLMKKIAPAQAVVAMPSGNGPEKNPSAGRSGPGMG